MTSFMIAPIPDGIGIPQDLLSAAQINEPQAVTLDGEVYTQTPVEACVADERLQLLVPDKSWQYLLI